METLGIILMSLFGAVYLGTQMKELLEDVGLSVRQGMFAIGGSLLAIGFLLEAIF